MSISTTNMATWTWNSTYPEDTNVSLEDRTSGCELEVAKLKTQSHETGNLLEKIFAKLEKMEANQLEILSRLEEPFRERAESSRSSLDNFVANEGEVVSGGEQLPPNVPLRRLSVAERILVLNFRARNNSMMSTEELRSASVSTASPAASFSSASHEDLEKVNAAAVEEICSVLNFHRNNAIHSKKVWAVF